MIKKFQAILGNAPNQKYFNTDFGQIKNLRELRHSLYSHGKKFFNLHVNQDENHFANWVEHVFEDKEFDDVSVGDVEGSIRPMKE